MKTLGPISAVRLALTCNLEHCYIETLDYLCTDISDIEMWICCFCFPRTVSHIAISHIARPLQRPVFSTELCRRTKGFLHAAFVIVHLILLDGVAPLIADPPQWNSITRQNLLNLAKSQIPMNQSCDLKILLNL